MSGWASLSGYLHLKPGGGALSILKAKKRMWCVLEESQGRLLYFKSEDDARSKPPLGYVELRGAAITLDMDNINQFVIIVDNKDVLLTAENHESMMIWLMALQARRDQFTLASKSRSSSTSTENDLDIDQNFLNVVEMRERVGLDLDIYSHSLSPRSSHKNSLPNLTVFDLDLDHPYPIIPGLDLDIYSHSLSPRSSHKNSLPDLTVFDLDLESPYPIIPESPGTTCSAPVFPSVDLDLDKKSSLSVNQQERFGYPQVQQQNDACNEQGLYFAIEQSQVQQQLQQQQQQHQRRDEHHDLYAELEQSLVEHRFLYQRAISEDSKVKSVKREGETSAIRDWPLFKWFRVLFEYL